MSESLRNALIDYAEHFIGRWYIWGGDDPFGFDCSGFVIECLKAIGKLPRKGDWTANGLSKMFKPALSPYRGDLVFWSNGQGRVIHVEILINSELSIGASGGGSKTTTIAKAIQHNAFIKMRPITIIHRNYDFTFRAGHRR
jgi:D-gamma-glutamyl-meso-diaminopimelic acid endopeptidase CwlS